MQKNVSSELNKQKGMHFCLFFHLFMVKYFRVSDIICHFETEFFECGIVLFMEYPKHCGRKYAFALISRLAKSVGNSFGIITVR